MTTTEIAKTAKQADPLDAIRRGTGALTADQVREALALASAAVAGSSPERVTIAESQVADADAALTAARDAYKATVRDVRKHEVLLARTLFILTKPAVRGEVSIPASKAADALGLTKGRVSQLVAVVADWHAATGTDRIPDATYAALAPVRRAKGGSTEVASILAAAEREAIARARDDKREGEVRVTGSDVSQVMRARAAQEQAPEPLPLVQVIRQVDRWIDRAVRDGVAPGEVDGEAWDAAHLSARLAVLARVATDGGVKPAK